MRVYLDTCSLQRPLDSKTHIRVALEAEAVLGILSLCQSGEVELVSSDALRYEVERTPNPVRQEFARQALSAAKVFVGLSPRLERRAAELSEAGIRPLDALHLASAEEIQADCFCTCDSQLLRRAPAVSKVKVLSPLELIVEVEDGGTGKATG